MKPYKINLFRLGLLLPTYLVFNVVYAITYDSGGFAFIILWPAFFFSLALIFLGNIFIFRDISKLKSSLEDNEFIQKTSTIQLVLATIGFFMQIIGFPLNYIDNYPVLVCASIMYSIILLIGIYQTIKLGQGKDILAILGFVFAFMVILYTCLGLITATSSSIKNTTPNFAEEFQSLGLKGKVELVDKHREIEMFNGTVYNLTYTENLSDGTILKKYTDAKIHKDGEHLSNFFLPSGTDLETLLNDKEKALFHTVKQDEFSFLLDVYKERPNLQQEEDSIKNTTADKINKLFDTPIASSFKFGKYPIENYYVAIMAQAVSNREKGDFDAAGFYNITTKYLMKNKGLTLDIDCDLSNIKAENASPVETLKEKILSLPKNSFSDGIYNISCSYDENGIKKKVTCPFVVEDGVGHFEEDKLQEDKN
ncbi:hypothetical protein [Streptococcus lactarius]|uniref:Uncharacterized protein n=1 Tax=Streptococcus lactarius TaxID=684066 RepID=A0A9X1BBY3_9STRE|nr:hypothetical protein [Streptococcus lactarius]MBK4779237.1 hypothetical protein [Streptococcus lactarius]QUB39616.1 hypothetical protein J4854_03995 [Streptococcus lactarius]